MRHALLALLCTLPCSALSTAAEGRFPGPTAREVVEFTRILQPRDHNPDALRSQVSPDGGRAFVVTRKADVDRDRNRYEILLLDLTPERLESGRELVPEAVLSFESEQDVDYADPSLQDVRWSDDHTLVFLARMREMNFQVYRLDIRTRELGQLTREPHRIVSFAASHDLRRVLYAVQIPNPPMRDGERSVVVGSRSFWSVKFGQQDLRSQDRLYRFFVADSQSSGPPRALGDVFPEGNGAKPRVSISPDGRWGLLPRYEPERQLAWARQYPMVAESLRLYGPSLVLDPLGYYSRPKSYVVRRMVAVRLDDGREQTIVDAPDDALPGGGQDRTDRLWQGDGASVVLAGTHLPVGADEPARPGSYIIEYWPDGGRWATLAALAGRMEDAHATPDGFVVIDSGRRRQFRRHVDGRWEEAAGNERAGATKKVGWTLRIDEGLDQPPQVVAVGTAGQIVRLTHLNPAFAADAWGAMRPYRWQDAKGRRWDGGLMSGEGMDQRRPQPLVIQTYGFAPDRFYLDGPNVADGFTSAFAGRAFLREGILVLAMPWGASTGAPGDVRESVQAFIEGVKGAVGALVREGRVDPARVGIIGWSATGERVLSLVTFSGMPVRAATLADGDANTLFSLAVTYGAGDVMWSRKERLNEGLPYGPTLKAWARNDPALHTDCVRAALRIETYGPWVLNNWDVYALLRRQYKPAEMVVIPGGAHALSRPSERLISLQGNVDWYRFWLTGQARTEPFLAAETAASLQAQYERWQEMARLKSADDARPACGLARARAPGRPGAQAEPPICCRQNRE